MPQADLEEYCAQAMAQGVTHAIPIDPKTIVTAPWVRLKCQFGCDDYNRNYCCPPFTPTLPEAREIIASYRRAILFHLAWKTDGQRSEIEDFQELVVDLERKLLGDGYYKAFSMVACHCPLCEECALFRSLPCEYPSKARPPMAALSIDVFQTAKNNSLHAQPLRGEGEEVANIFCLMLAD
jgi:predicted metal-binding protein